MSDSNKNRDWQVFETLYYMLMLFALLINGAGKISIDHLISKRLQ